MLNSVNCNSALKAYCDNIVEFFSLQDKIKFGDSSLEYLYNIFEYVINDYNNKNISTIKDINDLKNTATKKYEQIRILFEIEKFINEQQSENKIERNNIDAILQYLDKIETDVSNKKEIYDEGNKFFQEIRSIIENLIRSEEQITQSNLDKINTVIEKYHEIYNSNVVTLRKLYFTLFEKIQKNKSPENI